MRSELTTMRVEDLIAKSVLVVGDGYRAKNNELGPSGIPFARAANINDGFHFAGVDRFPIADISKVGNKVSKAGDVVFTSKGTVGRFAFVSENVERFLDSPQRCFWRSVDHDRLRPRFLYYWMQSSECLDQIEYLKGQTDMADYVSLRDQRRMTISFPPPGVQDEIAETLTILDTKIALLRETNATLEAIAQALFKSWFVDFDPVRARLEGRDPEAVPPEVADLFPGEFEDSELGAVPKGWRVGDLGEVIQILDYKRVPLSSGERAKRQGTFPYYGAAALMDHVDDYLFDGIYLLMGEDGSVTNPDGTPVLQYVWGKLWVNNHAHVLLGKGAISTEHIMLFLKRTNITAYVTGAVQAKLNQGNLNRIPFILPSETVAIEFAHQIDPLFASIRANEEQSRTLQDLRDTLLPRLMSGKLRNSDVEEILA